MPMPLPEDDARAGFGDSLRGDTDHVWRNRRCTPETSRTSIRSPPEWPLPRAVQRVGEEPGLA